MDTKELTVWHNFIYSTKGGCGKTTLSLNFPKIIVQDDLESFKVPLQCFDPSQSNWRNNISNSSTVVILDMDLAASNINDIPQIKTKVKEIRYLLNYLIKKERFVYQGNENTVLIMGPTNEHERNYFKTKRRYIPTVRFEEFKYSILALINDIIFHIARKTDNKILNLVYDLPPNSDGFTEILFDALLNQKNFGLCEKESDITITNKFRLLIPSNPEVSIKNVNYSWMQAFLSNSGSNRKFNQIFMLDNEYLADPHDEKRASKFTKNDEIKVREDSASSYGSFVGYSVFGKELEEYNKNNIIALGKFDNFNQGENCIITLSYDLDEQYK